MTRREKLVIRTIQAELRGLAPESALTILIHCTVCQCVDSARRDRASCAKWLEAADTALLCGAQEALKGFGS